MNPGTLLAGTVVVASITVISVTECRSKTGHHRHAASAASIMVTSIMGRRSETGLRHILGAL